MGKLIKYEFRNSRKSILQIFGIIMLISLILQILGVFNVANLFEEVSVNTSSVSLESGSSSKNLALGGIVFFIVILGILILFATVIAFNIRVANILKKDLYKEEGYLTFFLPKSGFEIILAKVLVTFIWTMLLVLMVTLGNIILFLFLMIFPYGGNTLFVNLGKVFSEIFRILSINRILLSIVNMISSSFLNILLMFTAIVFDYRVGAKKNDTLIWIIYYLVFSIFISYFKELVFPLKDMSTEIINRNFGSLTMSELLPHIMRLGFNILMSVLLFIYVSYNFENKIEK